MIRKYKFTAFSLMIATLFIFGSMATMNCIFERRESQILSETGQIYVESPVREWESQKNGTEPLENVNIDHEEYALSPQQIEEAIDSWNHRSKVILHDRVVGQISMEDAIENGKGWMAQMGIRAEKDMSSFSINAELGVGGQKENTDERREAYFSFWMVTYSDPSMNVTLTLNAVTGKVYGAKIELYERPYSMLSDHRLRLFAELAGLQVPDDAPIIIDSGGITSRVFIKNSSLVAQEQVYSMNVGFEKSYDCIVYQLLVDPQ